MMHQKRGIAIVGCGWWAQVHASFCNKLNNIINLYFVSRSKDNAWRYVKRFNAKGFYPSLEDAAEDRNIHGFILCSPPYVHYEQIKILQSYQKPVLVEKPVAHLLDEAYLIQKMCAHNHFPLMVAENFCYIPTLRKIKHWINEGRIGKIRRFRGVYCCNFTPRGWRLDKKLQGGGCLIEVGIHLINALHFLLGKEKKVRAFSPANTIMDMQGEDTIFVETEMHNEVYASVECSYTVFLQDEIYVEILGSQGAIFWHPKKSFFSLETLKNKKRYFAGLPERFNPDKFGRLSMLKDFLDAIQFDKHPEMDICQGVSDLEFVDLAYKSLISNKWESFRDALD